MSETFEQFMARELSFYQWEFLADHFQGPRPIRPNEERTRMALARHKLIKVDQCYKPTATIITERGHGVMCAAMGMMADVLMKGGYDQPKRKPMEKYGYGKLITPARHSPDGDLSLFAENQSR